MVTQGSDEDRPTGLSALIQSQPLAAIMGSLSGVVVGIVSLLLAQSPAIKVLAVGQIAAAVLLALIAVAARNKDVSVKTSRLTLDIGRMLYGLLISSLAGLSLTGTEALPLQLLLFTHLMVFATGITTGHTAKPIESAAQLAAIFAPIIAALLYVGGTSYMALAIMLPAMAASLFLRSRRIAALLNGQIAEIQSGRELVDQMRRQVSSDPVTKLYNRKGFELVAERAIAQSQTGQAMALFWIDLHRFKDINDTMGHTAGDKVLHEVGNRLTRLADDAAIIARFGSDEFLLLTDCPNHSSAQKIAETICQHIARPIHKDGHRIDTGATVGVAMIFDHSLGLSGLMDQADQALYHARIAGKGHIRFHNAAMSRKLVRMKEIEADLRSAIQKDELSIYFQPIIDLDTGHIHTMEALVRWFHPERGELLPSQFIPAAEETGLIITLGNWITKQAARTCATWPDHVRLAINLSPLQTRAPGAALGIIAALREAHLDPARLDLELTEEQFLQGDTETQEFMREMTAHGVRFALDDFGIGMSSLAYISRYNFSSIKLDRSLICAPEGHSGNAAIIQAVADMGRSLNMDVVAEGLETHDQLALVKRAGCTLGQGFLYSRPVPDHLAARLLADEQAGNGDHRLAS